MTASLLEANAARLETRAKARAEAIRVESQAGGISSAVGSAMGASVDIDDTISVLTTGLSVMAVFGGRTEAPEVPEASNGGTGCEGNAAVVGGWEEHWMGATSMCVLLEGLTDSNVDAPRTREAAARITRRICAAMMLQIASLSEEELERENQQVRATRGW